MSDTPATPDTITGVGTSQTVTTEVVQVLTLAQALRLRAMIEELREIVKACEKAAWDAPSSIDSGARVRAQDYGRLCEACSVAADVTFNVINVANAYCKQSAAAAVLKR